MRENERLVELAALSHTVNLMAVCPMSSWLLRLCLLSAFLMERRNSLDIRLSGELSAVAVGGGGE
ncbi:hypothetical protein ACIRRA_06780 [Nocardia sp. NPDC101769]|uniref:hypothetical protein n=1 Tax=Nocardia sp. NPDC101769 TaxID=3364333 RepID=UPI00382AD034